jgi:hypothetical protein
MGLGIADWRRNTFADPQHLVASDGKHHDDGPAMLPDRNRFGTRHVDQLAERIFASRVDMDCIGAPS